jgi:hypothetical protein
MFSSDKALFYIGLILARWYNETVCDPQEEAVITVYSKKGNGKFIYKHKIETNFDMLNEICNTQIFSETVKRNLSH